jgi:membrane protease YdiL (CAAX protease family)
LNRQRIFDRGNEHNLIVLDWWQAILLALAIGFAAVIAGGALSMFISNRWASLAIEVLVYFLPVFILIHLSRLREARIFSIRGRVNFWLGVLIIAVAAAYSVSASTLIELAHCIWPIPKLYVNTIIEVMRADSIPEFLGVVFVSAIVPAVAEELLFRGVVQPALIKRIGPMLGIVLTSLLFAFYHLNPWTFVPLFIVGTLFGFLAYKTGTFWAGALAHFGNNLLAIVELNRTETVDYAALTEGAPWYILASGAVISVVGTVALLGMMPVTADLATNWRSTRPDDGEL